MIPIGKSKMQKGRKSKENDILGWPKKVPLVFKLKKKKATFFIFTKNFIEQRIHPFVPLPSATFQATS